MIKECPFLLLVFDYSYCLPNIFSIIFTIYSKVYLSYLLIFLTIRWF